MAGDEDIQHGRSTTSDRVAPAETDHSVQGHWRKATAWVVGCGAVLMIGIVAATGLTISQFRERTINSAARELRNAVLLVGRHFDQQFEELKLTLAQAAEGVNATIGHGAPDELTRRLAGPLIHQMLHARDRHSSDVSGMNLFDESGQLVNSSEPRPLQQINIADRSYFSRLRDANAELIVELVQSRFNGEWAIVLAQRLTTSDGSFLGVITRAIRSSAVESFLASVTLGDGSAISMFHMDGTLAARHPRVPALLGRNFHSAPLLMLARSGGDGLSAMRIDSPVDGQERIGAVQPLKHFPLAILATTTTKSALADWREQTWLLLVAALLLILIIAGMMFVVARAISRHHRISREQLALQKSRLDTALDNMEHGLLLFGSDQRLIVCSKRYLELVGMAQFEVRPGMTLRELMEARHDLRSIDYDIDAYLAEFDRNLSKGERWKQELTSVDGKVSLYLYTPLEDGGWVTTIEDVTERKRSAERIAHLAHFDPLTDLPNRALFRDHLSELLGNPARTACAVLYVDVDEFKSINDALGHSAGDELLKTLAGRLQACVANDGFVARLGGDEFAIVLHDVESASDVEAMVDTIYDAIREPCDCFGHQIATDASIGIALGPEHGRDIDQLLKHADLAMYAAKSGGRRMHRFFEPEMDERIRLRQQLEQDLRQLCNSRDFAGGGLKLVYQPIVSLKDNTITGCEALLRWQHPVRGLISPADFIPVAEDTGLISTIGDWVLATACSEAARWPDGIKIAVNVSPVQFRSRTLPFSVVTALAISGLAASRLELEITEAVLIADVEAAQNALDQLRTLGVRTALDDFGTGYSSLSYLQRFSFDKIKIDRAFVAGLDGPDCSPAIVQAVITIAAARHMITTAEGVETEGQRERLRTLGCKEMQGYLFSRPLEADQILGLLAVQPRPSAAA